MIGFSNVCTSWEACGRSLSYIQIPVLKIIQRNNTKKEEKQNLIFKKNNPVLNSIMYINNRMTWESIPIAKQKKRRKAAKEKIKLNEIRFNLKEITK